MEQTPLTHPLSGTVAPKSDYAPVSLVPDGIHAVPEANV